LQPVIPRRDAVAWNIAFQIVENFLESFNMVSALDSYSLEKPPTAKVNVAMMLNLPKSPHMILQLIRSTARNLQIPLRQRIADGAYGSFNPTITFDNQ
jgi:hypothetical protein